MLKKLLSEFEAARDVAQASAMADVERAEVRDSANAQGREGRSQEQEQPSGEPALAVQQPPHGLRRRAVRS